MLKNRKTLFFWLVGIIIGIILFLGFYPRTFHYYSEIDHIMFQKFGGKCISKACEPPTADKIIFPVYMNPVYEFKINYVQHLYILSGKNNNNSNEKISYDSCFRGINCH